MTDIIKQQSIWIISLIFFSLIIFLIIRSDLKIMKILTYMNLVFLTWLNCK